MVVAVVVVVVAVIVVVVVVVVVVAMVESTMFTQWDIMVDCVCIRSLCV